jgi:hypothetical protein
MVMTINGGGDARSFMPDTFPIVAYRREPGLRITIDVCHRKSQPFQKWHCLQLSAKANFRDSRSGPWRGASLRTKCSSGNFDLPLTHQELASRLGTVREVVSRNLARFRGEWLIRIQGHQVQIVNRPGLEQEAESQG